MRYADSYCSREERFEPEHVYVFSGPCVVTGEEYSVAVPAEGLFRYRRGALIQAAFPGIPCGDREFLMTGMSPEGFRRVFG